MIKGGLSRPAAASGWLAAALLAAACGGQAPADRSLAAGAPVDGGTVVFGQPAEPRELNCTRANDSPAVTICSLVCDTLIDYGPDLKIVPRLAESYEVSPSGDAITFHLRKGVLWQDGEPFTSRDVRYTVDQIRAPGAMIRGELPAFFKSLASLETPDDWTVKAVYDKPYALAFQAWARAFIMPAHLPFDPGASSPIDRAPVGTGPYRLTSWDAGQQIVLEANKAYFGGRPHLDRLVFRFASDPHTLALALGSGELDMTGLRPADAAGWSEKLPYELRRYPRLAVDFILWNVAKPGGLFADARVRRAMSLALDRKAYVDHVTQGNDVLAVSTFPPGSWAHDPDLKPLPHDPAAAAALLAEAGWKDRDGDGVLDTPNGPASFTLLVQSGSKGQESIGAMLKDELEPLGVRVRLQSLEWPVFVEKVRGGSFDAAAYRWRLDPDPDPYDFFHSSQAEGGLNYGGYSNPEVDRLSEEARGTIDIDARARIYHEIEKILREDQPYTFISHPGAILGVSRRVHGVRIGIPGLWGWYPGTLTWWIPASEQRPSS